MPGDLPCGPHLQSMAHFPSLPTPAPSLHTPAGTQPTHSNSACSPSKQPPLATPRLQGHTLPANLPVEVWGGELSKFLEGCRLGMIENSRI